MSSEPAFFAVHPITNCPHVHTAVSSVLNFELTDPCASCGNVGENWVCLYCSKVFCSRYVAGHMADHNASADTHCLAFSFSDLSFWCYSCDSYITSPIVRPILSAAHQAKFGVPLGDAHIRGAKIGGGAGGGSAPSRLGVPEDVTEFFDSPEELETKATELAALIKASRHTVAYTGAGISTSASIPDYRGPQGVWTLRDQGKEARMDIKLEQARPTRAHMALVGLMRAGYLSAVVSTNIDGLHLRSGVPAECLMELHGNCYLEKCAVCGHRYLRSYDLTGPGTVHGLNHETGRFCEQPGCQGILRDSIINFGENLPEAEMMAAFREADASDLSLVLGTSMRVSPACDIPLECLRRGGKMVICNLQPTPKDHRASLRLFARTDQVLELVMEKLGLEIPEWTPDTVAQS